MIVDNRDNKISKTSDKIQKGIFSIFNSKKIDSESLEQLEELLISTDINISLVEDIITYIKNNRYSMDTTVEDIKKIIFDKLLSSLKENMPQFNLDSIIDCNKPVVMLFLGVNGCGKTTVIGKLADRFKKQGKKVLLSACDTFRAGATEQLQQWAMKVGVDIMVAEKEQEDPASLAYKSYEKAKKENYDILLIDTAGRLQNNINLMNELAKIDRVLKKIDSSIPQQIVLVLDATIGQNSQKQFDIFNRYVAIDSVVMNKLDGTSKGGILLSIVNQFKKPIFAIGVGEKVDDLEDFDGEKYLKNLLGIE